jgi:serine kinase of HPr protein (carbohydrate metabolism regulator)
LIVGDLYFKFSGNLSLPSQFSCFQNSSQISKEIFLFQHFHQINFSSLLFSAEDSFEDNPFIRLVIWRIYNSNNGYCINILSRKNPNLIIAQLFLDEKFYPKSYYINHPLAKDIPEYPLPYPLMHLILYYAFLNEDAVMIHASAIIIEDKAYLFSAFSGTGKTTIARWFYNKGFTVINDDRIVLRKIGDQIFAYNSPMYQVQKPMAKPLGGIFYIQQYHENEISKLAKIDSLVKMQQMIIRHNYHRYIIDKQLTNTENIVNRTHSFQLKFTNSDQLVEDILTYITN